MSAPTKTGLAGWLDAPASDVHRLDEHTVYTTCRCGARVEASAPDQIRAMLAGHWLFDADHAAYLSATATLDAAGGLSDFAERADYLGVES